MAAEERRREFSHGYAAFGSFTLDVSVEAMMATPPEAWVPPRRDAVPTESLFDEGAAAPAFGREMKAACFHVDPAWTFLNHGAFGGAARVSLTAVQRWSEHAEAQPLRFIDRELFPLMCDSARAIAALVRAPPACVALIPNATYGLHSVIMSCVPSLAPGDVLFCLDVGYGSVRKMLDVAAARSGARVVVGKLPSPLPLDGDATSLAAFVAAQIPPATALAVFDHVTSNTGLLLPAASLTAAARAAGARTILIDGAHGLGALDLNLPAIGADYYVSNAHKWLASARGVGMLYSAHARDAESLATGGPPPPTPRPAVISHGWGAGFASEFVWDGCRDYAPAVSLVSLLRWWHWVGLDAARAYCGDLLEAGVTRLCERWGTRRFAPRAFASHMACVQLPSVCLPRGAVTADGSFRCTPAHSKLIQDALHFGFDVEVPAKTLPGPEGGDDVRSYVRVSAFVYNDLRDFDALADAVLRIAWDEGATGGPRLRVVGGDA